MRSRLSQALLDNLAVAWSRLDRARPREETDVPALLIALDEWMRWAVRMDDELTGALGATYVESRCQRPGGPAIRGLRHPYVLKEHLGHPLDALVTVSAGSPELFYDLIWKRYEELPHAGDDPAAEHAYRLHFDSQPARAAASQVTTFLLTAASLSS